MATCGFAARVFRTKVSAGFQILKTAIRATKNF